MQEKINKEKIALAADVVNSLHAGTSITDEDLVTAIKVLEIVVLFLDLLGPKYHLAVVPLRRDMYQLMDFQSARERHRITDAV